MLPCSKYYAKIITFVADIRVREGSFLNDRL